jgi:hypothetical protein
VTTACVRSSVGGGGAELGFRATSETRHCSAGRVTTGSAVIGVTLSDRDCSEQLLVLGLNEVPW